MSDSEVQVDLTAKRTEAGWIAAQDKLWLAFTPKLFEWLGWVALLGGLKFINQKNPTVWLGTLIGLCHAAMFLYFFAYFARLKFVGIPWVESERKRHMISTVISGLLALLANELARAAIEVILRAQP